MADIALVPLQLKFGEGFVWEGCEIEGLVSCYAPSDAEDAA